MLEPYKDRLGERGSARVPIDLRYVDHHPFDRRDHPSETQQVWLRADGELPDDPVLHACIVTYASDMTLLDTTVRPFGLAWDSPDVQMASLDHAMWFHRPFRADDWLLYDQRALSTSSARGLAGGTIFTARREAGGDRRAGGPDPHGGHAMTSRAVLVVVGRAGARGDRLR